MAEPLYLGLTAKSTPEQVAAAYSQFAGGAGGDTAANQKEAVAFLQSRGIGGETINQAYDLYSNPTFESSGFESSGPLTSDVATSLMQRSMTTGVPTYEFDRYGGYDAVQALYNANGGSYTMSDIDPYMLQNYANQVSRTGIGNLSALAATNTPLAGSGITALLDKNRGLDPDTIRNSYQVYANPTRLAQEHARYLKEQADIQERIRLENLESPRTFNPLYTDLTGKSTPGAIAAAYAQFAEKSGGDTAKNQQEATAFLKKIGVSDADIAKGYNLYRGSPSTAIGALPGGALPATSAGAGALTVAGAAPTSTGVATKLPLSETQTLQSTSDQPEIDPYVYAYEYGVANNDFSGLRSLLQNTPDSTQLISKYGLTPEQINRIEFGTGFDLDQSGGYGAGKVGNDWDYNKYLDKLRAGDADSLNEAARMFATLDPLRANSVQNMFDELLKQQTVTGDNWSAGNLGSKEAAAMDFALRLAENGVGSIYDLGQRRVDVVTEGYNGPEVGQITEYYNKKTGEALPDWGRVASGTNSGSRLTYNLNFAEDGTPIPYTTRNQSDWLQFREGFVKPALSIVALANPALAPYIAAGNAINAADKGDWGSAVVSALTAATGFSGDLGLSASTVESLNTAKTGAQILNAIDKGNPIAIANALAQTSTGQTLLSSDMGNGITLGDVINTAKVAASVSSGDYTAALDYASSLTGNPNLKVAASSVNLLNAIQTGDPFKIITAMGQLDKTVKTNTKESDQGGITNRVVDDAVSTDNTAIDAFTAAKNAGATDQEAMDAANAVTGTPTTNLSTAANTAGDGVVVNKIPDSESGNVVTTTYGDVKDTEFGNLQGAIETNAMDDAVRADRLNVISNLPKFADAYSEARTLLGPNKTFTWNGKEYSTATAAERPDLTTPKVEVATDESAAETARLNRLNTNLVTGNAPYQSAAETARLANQNADLKSMEKTGFLGQIYKDLNEQFRLQGVAANEYLKNNPNSPITSSISTAFEAAGNLQKNVGGGTALLLNNKPLADALVKGGDDLTKLGQNIGTGPQDTKNWNDTLGLIDKAKGFEKVAVMAGRIMDGTSGLGRQVEVELRQELPGLFLGGGSVKGIMLATGAMDTAETAGNAALDAYDDAVKNGKNHADALSDARKAGAVAGATEAAVQLTLGKLADFGAGKISNVAGKSGTKVVGEGIVEGGQEGGAALAVDLALGNELDANKYLTQTVVGGAVGKGTAAATTGVDAAQTTATAGDAATTSGNTAATSTGAATDLGTVGATVPGADVVQGTDLGSVGSVTPGADAVVGGASTLGDAGAATVSVADAEQTMADLGLNVSGDAAVSLATKIQEATNSGNDVSVTSGANTVTIADATANTNTTFDTATGVTTTVDNANNVTTVVDGNTTTAVDANTNTTTQTTVDTNTNTQTTVTTNANTNTNTQTTVNTNTNTTTSVTVDTNNNTTTQTTIDGNTNTQTTVLTDTNTNTQTTVKVNTETGDVIEVTETEVPTDWKPPVIDTPVVPPTVVPPTVVPPTKPVVPKPPTLKGSEKQRVGGGFGLPSGINVDPASLRSQVTGGAIDPLARVKQAQAELERDVMMNQLDPRFAAVIQQRTDPQQQAQQYDKDIGALAKLLSGEPSAPANEGKYYSYGSEDSIDSILGGKAANYKEGGFVEPLKASGGMVLPLLAKSGGALGKYSGREDFKDGKHVAGDGDGQSDDIPAWLADGEFVFPADVVSALGNGSTKAGTDKLYEMMHGIRDRARSKGPKDLPPPALKSPLDYLKSSKRSK